MYIDYEDLYLQLPGGRRMTYTTREVIEFVEENDVKFIRLAFCDLFGRLKNISIMADELPYAFEHGVPFDGSSIRGFSDISHSDLRLIPDPATLAVLPWRPQQGRVVRFYCHVVNADKTPFVCDSRGILQQAIDHAAKSGYRIHVGEECEFYLFKQDENGEDTDIPYDKGTYLDVSPADRGENIRREICLVLEQMDIHPETSHHESGPGQNEIVFRFGEAMEAADNLLTFKNVVRAIALRNGAAVSFSPKPIADNYGNGMHINLSIYRGDTNLFAGNKPEDLKIAQHFMAGILNRISEITLFLNPVKESYERLGAFEAPRYISWSNQNRSQLMRIPAADGDRRRMELRSPDAYVNPYLAYALLIEAGLEGIDQKAVLMKPTDMDLTVADAGEVADLELLPQSLEEAVAKAKSSTFVAEVIGETAWKAFIAEKEA